EETLLTAVLLECESISARVHKKAQKLAEKNECSLGAALLELDSVDDGELLHAIEEGVTREVTEAFGWELEESSFHTHDSDERYEGFVSELSDYFDLLADPETLFLEAAQRLERWDLVQECFDLLLDVFYATPGTFGYFRDPDSFPVEIRLLGSIDGTKDIEEVIAESGIDPFTAIEATRNLVRDGAIELINPVQLFQLGAQAESAGNVEKASRLFRRAMERGLDDFDIELRLAQSLESIGRKNEAAASYFRFSNKCLAQLRVDDALRSLRRVIKLSPEQNEASVKLLNLLVQHNRADEAVETALAQAERLDSKGDGQAALDILMVVRESNVRDVRLHEKIIDLGARLGDLELVRREKETVAQEFDGRRDTKDALESYQRRFCDGDDSLEVRMKLVELHKQHGNRQKAIDHINSVLSLGGKRRVKEVDKLLWLHGAMLDLEPGDTRSNRFLISYSLQTGDKAKAVEVLKAWLPELQKNDDFDELISALQQLISLEDRLEFRWTLAQLLEKVGRRDESHQELHRLAHHGMRNREFDQAAKALDHVLKTAPLDIETRKAQAELFDLRGEKELAAEKLLELASLEIIAGRIQEAEGFCRQVMITRPEDADVIDRFGKLCLELGDRQKAIEQFLKAAKIHLENKNLGLARRTLDRLLKQEPGHTEASTLVDQLQTLERNLERKPEPQVRAGGALSAGSEPVVTQTEPFAGPKPVRTSVTGITARLRNLKSGGDTKKKASSNEGVKTAVSSIAAKLKSVQGGGESGASSSSPAPKDSGEAKPAQNPKVALKSAAARLKALSQKKKQSSDDSAAPASSSEPPETAAAPATTPADSADNSSPGNAPPTAKVKQKKGAASRLAALRKQSK
ncbi:MAG: tetratricopeptide repeat protein, partial [Planctomycetota bacterium]